MQKKRDLLSVTDFTYNEIEKLFKLTDILKKEAKKENLKIFKRQIVGDDFSKTSTRTRVSFEVAMYQLGGQSIFLNKNDIQLNKGETINDTAKVLSRYLDGIMIRTYAHEDVVNLAQSATIPVINGLTDLLHPCQALADFYTIYENNAEIRRNPKNLKMTFIGDGNNVANSLILLSAIMGNTFVMSNPKGYHIPAQILELSEDYAKKTGAKFVFEPDPLKAAKGADVLYTDVWVSMGQESESEEKVKVFKNYQINGQTIKQAKTDVIVLHCLPANRGMEITDEVMDGPALRVFDEAENRLHVQKAVLLELLK